MWVVLDGREVISAEFLLGILMTPKIQYMKSDLGCLKKQRYLESVIKW